MRSRKDADAVEAMLERFYPEWGVVVRTLKGSRSLDSALSIVEGFRGWFVVVLLGREDSELARSLRGVVPPTFAVHVVPRARVRNARLELIAREFARARALLRATVWWNGFSYVFSYPGCDGCRLLVEPSEPSYEPFIGLGSSSSLLSRLLSRSVPENPLIVRTIGGLHEVYGGGDLIAKIEFTDYGVRPRVLEVYGGGVAVDINDVLKANEHVLRAFEEATMSFLKSLGGFDRVIVPWSGGKDSTAALLVARKLYGARRVVAVFTDTGTEFPQTLEYVERVSKTLGVDVYRVYAGIDKEILSGNRGLPSHSDRWCTGLKIKATEKAIAELAEGRTLVVLGDRDAESMRRSLRPPARGSEGIVFAAPLRLWSAAHVQLYLLSNNIPLNPLYELGFYRIGCYMCPSLRSWELHVISSTKLYYQLLKYPIFRKFICKRVLGCKG